jgi:hypothetical protein
MYVIEKPKRIDLLKIVVRKATVKDCAGCRDNVYNRQSNTVLGLATGQCWCLGTARLVRRKQIHINDIPPWHWQPVQVVPSCYRKAGYVYVGKDQLC